VPPDLQAGRDRLLLAAEGDWPYWRDLHEHEAASGVDPPVLDHAMQLALERLIAAWYPLRGLHVADLLGQVTDALARHKPGDTTWVGDLHLPALDSARIAAGVEAAIADGRATGIMEAHHQGLTPILARKEPPDHAKRVADYAAGAERLLAAGLVQTASREAFRLTAAMDVDVQGHVEAALGVQPTIAERDVLAGMATGGINEGRWDVIDALQGDGTTSQLQAAADDVDLRLYALEILDKNTCTECRDIDGQEYASNEQARQDYPGVGGGYVRCLGRTRCRGSLVYVHRGEAPPTAPLNPDAKPTPPDVPPPAPVKYPPGTLVWVVKGNTAAVGYQAKVLTEPVFGNIVVDVQGSPYTAQQAVMVVGVDDVTLTKPAGFLTADEQVLANQFPTGTHAFFLGDASAEVEVVGYQGDVILVKGIKPGMTVEKVKADELTKVTAPTGKVVDLPSGLTLTTKDITTLGQSSGRVDPVVESQLRGERNALRNEAGTPVTGKPNVADQALADKLSAWNAYCGFGYTDMNSVLRTGEISIYNSTGTAAGDARELLAATERIRNLEALYPERGAGLVKDTLMHRGMSIEAGRDIVGEVLTDPGFLSTSLENGTAYSFAQSVPRAGREKIVVRIHGRKGQLYIAGGHSGETELIFPPGSRLLVLRDNGMVNIGSGKKAREFDALLLNGDENP
jgi:hypothetical protein